MNRIYIASQTFNTVQITETIPVESRLFSRPLGQTVDEGPSLNNRPPPRMMATNRLRDLREPPFFYSADDCAFLAIAGYGTWTQQWHEDGEHWEQQETP